MTSVPPPALTAQGLVSTWAPDVLLLMPLALVLAYAVLLARHRAPWPAWRVLAFATATLVLAWAVSGAPAAYRSSLSWAGALSVGLTSAVVPLGLALGDPLRLWEEVRGRPVRWVRGRVARVVMFPLLASSVSAGALTLAFTTGWYEAARTELAPWAALQAAALATGLLVMLPLLSEELLPAWCGSALRTAFAVTDGMLDALPGLVVLASGDNATGQTLVAVAEAVGVPMIFAVLVQWVRADEVEARATDARLDAADLVVAPAAGSTGSVDPAGGVAPQPRTLRPWWESDPRFAGRYGGPPRDGG